MNGYKSTLDYYYLNSHTSGEHSKKVFSASFTFTDVDGLSIRLVLVDLIFGTKDIFLFVSFIHFCF